MAKKLRFKRKTVSRRVIRRRAFKKKGPNVTGTSHKASMATFRMPTGGSIVPDRLRTKLKYTSLFSVTSTSGAIQYQLMAGNGCFDPDITGSGHQPQGFDQYAALYQRYVCRGSAIKVSVNSNTAGSNYIFSVRPTSDVNDFSSNMSVEVEKSYVKWKVGTQSNPARPIKMYRSTAKMEGVPNLKTLISDDYSAPFTANPTALWYWIVSASNADQQTTTNFNYYVEVTYYVEFYDRKTIGQS